MLNAKAAVKKVNTAMPYGKDLYLLSVHRSDVQHVLGSPRVQRIQL